jgi:hypothetical protein
MIKFTLRMLFAESERDEGKKELTRRVEGGDDVDEEGKQH